ncbi:vacuolar protein sorting/targeting protein 10 [Microthyrium microscopicum]|uniref:Vacuolar protein sorting/targeting protein 10 n=1 Tax=Microthyrium microscopicum TaxID=703497 RepID=A0A6A6UTK2_9PEZI|nr:vacuolar protein sorting/targeting protein 10 [Microthyrium microscopicum]
MRLLQSLGALCILAAGSLVAAKDGPDVSHASYEFKNHPETLMFFEDSETALTIDLGVDTVFRTTNAGQDWTAVDGPDKGKALIIALHPRDNQVAVIVGAGLTHWITEDQGKSWRTFTTPEGPSINDPIVFHWDDPKRMLFNTFDSTFFGGSTIGKTYYTTDGFKSNDILHARRRTCNWAKSTDLFTTGDKQKDLDRTLCVVEGRYSTRMKDYKLMISDNFFKNSHEPVMSSGRTVSGMVNIASVKSFVVAAAKAQGSTELALYVSRDTETWHRAEFGDHQIDENAYTILEGTNYSIQVQVTPNADVPMGVLFTSNSNGTYFTKSIEHASRNRNGIMDFEKVQNIQGIFLVNEVENWKDLEAHPRTTRKKDKTKITFDDGRTFESLKVGNDELHLHSVTELRNSGRVFSSPAAGIVMGNGNTGEYLEAFKDANVFVSDDAGKTWIKADLQGPHKYEFGDQGSILLAIKDGVLTDEASYSLDHGKSWKKTSLGKKVQLFELTTIPDSTALRFVATGRDEEHNWWAISLDFKGLHERKCNDGDFEDWYARKNDKGEPQCLMGHKQHFRRRKPGAECFVQQEFKEALPLNEPCECTDMDFECDFNFRREGKECVPAGRILDPKVQCKDREGNFQGSSGWRLIPGDDCKRTGGKQKDDLEERPCKDVFAAPATGKVTSTFKDFRGQHFLSMYYLERGGDIASGTDESVVLLTDRHEAWITHDHGKNWDKATPGDEEIYAIYPHTYNNDYVYFITLSQKVYYSKNRGQDVHYFDAPDIPNLKGLPILSFHEQYPDWLIWTGNQDCHPSDRSNCHVTAHVSKKNGADDSWDLLMPWVKRCQFMYREGRQSKDTLMYCEHWQAEDLTGPLQLLSSEDNFAKHETVFEDVVAFATMAEYIVVAAKTEDRRWLEAHASVDGKTFAHAAFPPGFQVEHQSAYTVLDSATNAVFLHVTVSGEENQEYGSILKSNSNGTSYVVSVNYVNRNRDGYVDWEKMQGIEGVAIVNVIGNNEEMKRGAGKKLKTMITHDDGATWSYLPCPEKDLTGHSYECGSDLSKKALHLHGYTERRDPRETFSSPSAVGLMIGVGNVGEYLGLYNEGDTFLTKDGGITWKPIMKGTFMYEYGDQGSIIILVPRSVPTNKVWYSTDEGDEWHEYEFDHDGVTTVDRVTTVPSDNSRNFLLWGKKGGALTTVNLDFTGLADKQCKLDKENPTAADSDYELWSPKHPGKTDEVDCLFGHVSRYYRKKPQSNCYNGPLIERLHDIERNCTCTRQDFECDYNYERRPSDNICVLIQGLSPRPAEAVCTEDKSLEQYYEPTGYRKIPLSTCAAGRELEYVGESKPCPGHEKEFEEHHRGLSGAGLFFAIVLPISAAAAVGYYVYSKWDGKFGRIRLGESMGGNGGSFWSSEQPWIAWPVTVVSGLVALVAALPLLVGSVWRSVSGRFGGGYGGRTYTSRSSFARGRGDYASVADEGELLGDDSDEEV